MKKIILFLLNATICLTLNTSLFAAEINDQVSLQLNSGQTVEGILVTKDDTSIKVSSNDLALTYYLDEIESINGEAIVVEEEYIEENTEDTLTLNKPLVNEPLLEDAPTSAISTEEPLINDTTSSAEEELMNKPIEEPAPSSLLFTNDNNTESLSPDTIEETQTPILVGEGDTYTSFADAPMSAGKGAAAIIAVIIYIVSLLSIIIFPVCYYIIAEKIGIDGIATWLAFIPIVNILVIMKIARQPLWRLILLFVPIVNFFYLIAISFFTARACQKHWIWGLLLCIPVINTFVIMYLAYAVSKDLKKNP